MNLFVATAILLVLVALPAQSSSRDADIARLLGWLEGTFSTTEQARDDSTVYGHHLVVRRCLWGEKSADWLFAEYIDTVTGAPFKQEFWRISAVEHGLIEHAVFIARQPERWRGGTGDTAILLQLNVAKDLVLRRGCELYYQIGDRFYYGRTAGLACPSHRPDASTVIVTMSPKQHWIEYHERHINAVGEDVESRPNPIYYMKRDIVAGE
jgi:hypothetical protein